MTDYEPDGIDYVMEAIRDGFAELMDRDDAMETAALFAKGLLRFVITNESIIVEQLSDLGDRLEWEVRQPPPD